MKRIISCIIAAIMFFCPSAPFAYANSDDDYATREEAVACFIQAVGAEQFEIDHSVLERFVDISKISFLYKDAMSAAVNSGLLNGYEDLTLRPQAYITRIEALVILERALRKTELSKWYSVDFSDIPDWARAQVNRLASSGIVKGYGDGTLGAQDYLTLEQVNTLCDRISRFTGPAGDFYNYVNAVWLNKTSVTPDAPVQSDFIRLSQLINSNLNDIVSSLYQKKYVNGEAFAAASPENKILNVYMAAADISHRDKTGMTPILDQLADINNAKNISELIYVMADLEKRGFPTLVSVGIEPNIYNTSMYLPSVMSGYNGINPSSATDRGDIESYQKYISTLAALAGEPAPDTLAAYSAEICEELAAASAIPSGSISSDVTVCNMNELCEIFKNLNIKNYLTHFGYQNSKSFLVYNKLYARTADSLVSEQSLEKLKAYLKASVLDNSALYLSTAAFNAACEYNADISGYYSFLLPSDYAMTFTEELAGWELGSLYIDMYFPKNSKKAITELTQKILDEYENILSKSMLMAPETRRKAVRKLKTMKIHVAYPDNISDYCSPDIIFAPPENGGNLMDYKMQYNISRRAHFLNKLRLNEPTDNNTWHIYPQDTNASYNPVYNSITIPAGILQSPYFESSSSFEENLGGIGSVIAHEISHAFDATGSQFDENGNLLGWWTAQDAAAFDSLCNNIAKIYDGITYNGEYIDGAMTMNENLADIAGMACIIRVAGENNPNLDTMFRSYAEIWRTKTTDSYSSALMKADSHSPAKIRVNRVLSNFDAFINYYGIIDGDGMFIPPEQRIKIYD